MSFLKALDIEIKPRELTEEEEDTALYLAMEEGRKEGRLSEKEQRDFLKWMQFLTNRSFYADVGVFPPASSR